MNQIGAIHLQEFNGHATFRCSADGATANDFKVRGPVINPRIEETYQRARSGIDRREIGPFETVAHRTRIGQVAFNRRAAMLEGHDVVRLMPQTGIVLVQLAILATSTSTLPDEVPKLQRNPIAHRVA